MHKRLVKILILLNLIFWYLNSLFTIFSVDKLYNYYCSRRYRNDFQIAFLFIEARVGSGKINKKYYLRSSLGATVVDFPIKKELIPWRLIAYQIPIQAWVRKINFNEYQIIRKTDNELQFRPENYFKAKPSYFTHILLQITSTFFLIFLFKKLRK